MTKTSIIIITNNRSTLLKKCLDSIAGQLTKNDEIYVVNNASIKKETKKVINLIKMYQSKNVYYIYSNTDSIPKGRNKGLKKIKKDSNLVAFIDDDCLANSNWLKSVKEEHDAHQDLQVIQGKVISIPKDNLYARITGLTYQNWLRSNLLNKNLLKTFDSKNISFKKRVFRSGLLFNEKHERSSDIELGQRLQKGGFKIGYSPKIRVYHQERTSLFPFLKQHLNIARGESKTETITLFPSRYKYHLAAFRKLTWQLIKEGKILSLFQFLFLIPVILTLRAGVFLSRPLRYKP